MQNDSNPDLVQRASRGDEAALVALVAKWLPDVQRLVRVRAPRQLLLQESSADLAQSVCRDALGRIRRGAVEYRGEAPFRAWLLGAVELKLRERWRHGHAQRREAARAPAMNVEREDPADPHSSPSMALQRAESLARFENLLEQLDERAAQVVRRIQLDGLTHAEVGAELGIDASHSRVLLSRALARLAGLAREEDA